jgi:hypothetical protein
MPATDPATVGTAAESRKALEVATPDCIADDFDGEVVVLNIASGVYFSLRDVAGAVWRDLASGYPTSDLVAEIAAVDAQLGLRARELIAQIERHGLMRPRGAGETHPATGAESAALARDGNRSLALETFEDMKDLILADPIHDADEQAGWPVMPPRD